MSTDPATTLLLNVSTLPEYNLVFVVFTAFHLFAGVLVLLSVMIIKRWYILPSSPVFTAAVYSKSHMRPIDENLLNNHRDYLL